MGALLSFCGSAIAKIFGDKVLSWVALKIVLGFLFIVVLPILFNNALYDIIETVMNFATSQAGGSSAINGQISMTGFAAWLVQMFRVAECVSVLVSALILRATLNMIPMIRL